MLLTCSLELLNLPTRELLSYIDRSEFVCKRVRAIDPLLSGGNLRLVEGLIANTPIFYNAVVENVDYSGEGGGPVVVTSTAGTFIGQWLSQPSVNQRLEIIFQYVHALVKHCLIMIYCQSDIVMEVNIFSEEVVFLLNFCS
jgi:hypothetical protein